MSVAFDFSGRTVLITGGGRGIGRSLVRFFADAGATTAVVNNAGIIGFTLATAKEVASFGITVNAISPNAETDMVASIPPDRAELLRAAVPMGRFSDPAEVGPAIGVVLPVDGGLSM